MRLGLVDSVSEENYMIKPPEERPHQARARPVRLVVFRVIMVEGFFIIMLLNFQSFLSSSFMHLRIFLVKYYYSTK